MHNDLSKDNRDFISVNVLELLRFFDEKVEGSQGHATAIAQVCGEDLGSSLFLHYMKLNGIKAEIFSKKCTPGTKLNIGKHFRLSGSGGLTINVNSAPSLPRHLSPSVK